MLAVTATVSDSTPAAGMSLEEAEQCASTNLRPHLEEGALVRGVALSVGPEAGVSKHAGVRVHDHQLGVALRLLQLGEVAASARTQTRA